jgi:septal ring factor EnvC (AmiA/AmiB activator)
MPLQELSAQARTAGSCGAGGIKMPNLVESVKQARLEELERELGELKARMKDVWSQHLQIAEESARNLKKLAELEAEVAKLRGGD